MLTQVKRANEGGFTFSISENENIFEITIVNPPEWAYKKFSEMENHIQTIVRPANIELEGFKIIKKKEETNASINAFSRLGGLPIKASFTLHDFREKEIFDDENSREFAEIKKSLIAQNALYQSFMELSTEVTQNLTELVNTKSQLEIFGDKSF